MLVGWGAGFLIGVFAFLFSGSLSVASVRGKPSGNDSHEVSSWDQRRITIWQNCLRPSFKSASCAYDPNEGRFAAATVVGPLTKTRDTVAANTGRWVKETAWATTLAIAPNQATYWDERLIAEDYEGLKLFAAEKARHESLAPCQKACLAVCVSGWIIDAREGPIPQTPLGAIQSGKGSCREVAAVAVDFAKSLGIDAKSLYGTIQDRDDSTVRTYHTMLSVHFEGRNFLMEPQDPECKLSPL